MKNWHQKMLSLVLAAGLLATASPAMAATSTQSLTVKVNDQKIQYSKGIAPTVQQKVTLVPLRSTLQAMNIQLSKVSKDSITVVANGKSVTVNSKLFKINGTAYVPIRTFGELTGYTVIWNAKTRTIQLTSPPVAPTLPVVENNTPPVDTTTAPTENTASPVVTPDPSSTVTPTPVPSTETADTGGRGFMWEVQNNGNTVYLVGSIHIANESFYPLRKEYEQAFAQANYLGVEVDITQISDEAMQKRVLEIGEYKDGSRLQDHLSTYTYAKLGKALLANDWKRDALDRFKPWVADMIVSSFAPSDPEYKSADGIDLHFIQQAAERKITVMELESQDSQLTMLNNFSDELQEQMLYSTLYDLDNPNQADLHENTDEAAEMWKTGDEKKLLELTNSTAGNEEYNKAILVDRNVGMAQKIDGYLKSGGNQKYFIVVGAAHYLGNDGIIHLLEKKGYTVTRK
ncbi:hypothetical protein PTI45_04144 [Paenibacillus nuruki]|uniref:Copper amine oxidase-like N-terminal domain-containing protein n=1 Tax=Paenibacillus nuruki TaxID=1886670 RepID=A0A1E3KXW1_9BACL|nr:TraB/GumN family protein [Paenibacillus nuruki]ODP26304.1 hypothetical protein PTI45_04144 [Paenibacillus nuruki]